LVKLHEKWNPRRGGIVHGYDIAIIRLPGEGAILNYDEERSKQIVVPACLKWNHCITTPTDWYEVVGWGRTNNDAKDQGDIDLSGAHSRFQQKLDMSLEYECKKTYPYFKEDIQICAGAGLENKTRDSCQGDSGGPLLARKGGKFDIDRSKHLVGIVSYGLKTCGTGKPGIYTRVEAFIPWIISSMQSFPWA